MISLWDFRTSGGPHSLPGWVWTHSAHICFQKRILFLFLLLTSEVALQPLSCSANYSRLSAVGFQEQVHHHQRTCLICWERWRSGKLRKKRTWALKQQDSFSVLLPSPFLCFSLPGTSISPQRSLSTCRAIVISSPSSSPSRVFPHQALFFFPGRVACGVLVLQSGLKRSPQWKCTGQPGTPLYQAPYPREGLWPGLLKSASPWVTPSAKETTYCDKPVLVTPSHLSPLGREEWWEISLAETNWRLFTVHPADAGCPRILNNPNWTLTYIQKVHELYVQFNEFSLLNTPIERMPQSGARTLPAPEIYLCFLPITTLLTTPTLKR